MLSVKDRFLYKNDKLFFYLADTAWLLFDKLNIDEIKRYLLNRKSLGYNVIQADLFHMPSDLDGNKLYKGRNICEAKYWEMVLEVIKYANKLDIYFAILPCWGSIISSEIINNTNCVEYISFIVNYFKECNNIIYVLGGDIKGDKYFDVFNLMGEKIKELDPNKLVSFHPFGRTGSYLWFNDAKWIDFNMFQSGHRRYDQLFLNEWDDNSLNEDSFGEDNYKYVIKNNSYDNILPILDAEPSYEGILQGLHDKCEPYWEARHIRRYLYWSVLEGACGFCYGHNAVMQFVLDGEHGNYNAREVWYDAINAPGAAQMYYLAELFLKYDFSRGKAMPGMVINNKNRHYRISVNCSDDYIICYDYMGDKFTLDLTKYKNKTLKCYWMNPENNTLCYFLTIKGEDNHTFRPQRRYELSNDWLLVIEVENE